MEESSQKESDGEAPMPNQGWKIAGAAIVLLLMVVLGFVAEGERGRCKFDQAIRQLKELGEPVTHEGFPVEHVATNAGRIRNLQDVLIASRVFNQYAKVSDRTRMGDKIVLSMLDSWPAEVNGNWIGNVWDVLPGLVEGHRENLRRAAENATDAVELIPDAYDRTWMAPQNNLVNGYLGLHRLAWFAILWDLRSQRSEAAMQNALRTVTLLERFGSNHDIRALDGWMRATTIAVEGLWEILQHDGWTDEQLAELQSAWKRPHFLDPFGKSLRHYRVAGLKLFQEMLDQPRTLKMLIGNAGTAVFQSRDLPLAWSSVRWFWWPHGPAYHDGAFFLGTIRTNILAVELMVEKKLTPEAAGWSAGAPPKYQFTDRMMSSMYYRLSLCLRAEELKLMAITAIAIKRFELRIGRLPKQLDELVPDFLSDVPVDRYDGKARRYRRYDDGRFHLYSVGIDGRDNGASNIQMRERWSEGDNDIVWPIPATPDEAAIRSRQLQIEMR